MSVGIVGHEECADHDPGPGHPERPRRLSAVREYLLSGHLMDLLIECQAPKATREQLLRVHDAAYLDELARREPGEGIEELDPDTRMSPGTLRAASRAAGAAVHATDLVATGELERAFCAVRPPGHHAGRARAGGFCFHNNLAVGVAHALAVHGLERVAVFDFDAHYGDGTESIFADEPRVMAASIFQERLYPAVPAADMPRRFARVALPAAADGAAFKDAARETLLPALDRFRPQMVFVSAGFDGHLEDELAGLALLEPDYDWITRELVDLADHHAGGRLVSVLEGGYALDALGRSVAAHVKALLKA